MKILVALIYAIEFAYAAAYIYNGYPKRGSIAVYEHHRPDDDVAYKYMAAKAGYKSPDRSYPVKVKKESHTSADYHNYVAGQDSSGHASPVLSSGYNAEYSDGDGGGGSNGDGDYSTSQTSSNVNQQWNLYANRENYDSPHKLYVPFSTPTTPTTAMTTTIRAAAASHKVFVQHDDDSNPYYHSLPYRHPNQNVVVTKPTHVPKPQPSHVVEYKIGAHLDDILHSKVLDKPLIQKLSLAKVALIQIISLLSSLSAIKTIHVVAKASQHSEPISNHIEPPLSGPSEYADKPHYPHTLAGMILHFVAQLSRFNIEAKKNLIPNLLKVAGYASASSSRASAHKTR